MSAICKRVFSFRQHGAGSAALLLCALLLLPCSGCSGLKRYSVTFADVFDTVTTFTAYASSRGEFDALAQKLHEQLLEDHRRFDVYREYPGTVNLCTLNRLAGGEGVQADREIAELLHMADTMYVRTEGKLDISLGAVLTLWQEARERAAADPASARPPEASLLREAARHCGMELLELDADGTVRFLDPELRLDVGAVAKGWAQARAGELLDGAKCASWLLNMGGQRILPRHEAGRQPVDHRAGGSPGQGQTHPHLSPYGFLRRDQRRGPAVFPGGGGAVSSHH